MPETSKLGDLAYEDYLAGAEDPSFLRNIVTNMGDFSYTAQTNFVGGWTWPDDKERRVTLILQRALQDALEASGFHNLALLETRRLRDGVEFHYLDPDYQFTYSVDGRGRLKLTRLRSSAHFFHEWYRRFMPSFTHVLYKTVETIDEELTGLTREENDRQFSKVTPREPIIQVERASYVFNIAVSVSNGGEGLPETQLPNIQLLNRTLLNRVPSENGTLREPDGMRPDEFGRIDYNVARWNHQRKASEHYNVSAPSNNRWQLLVFQFGYVGETYVPSVGEREKFNQDSFLTGETTSEAYLDFLRQRCLCGFVRDVLFGGRGRSGLTLVQPRQGPDQGGFRYGTTPAAW